MARQASGAKRKYTTITIPAPLFEKIRYKIRDTGFSSVSDYVTYILRETTAEIEGKKGSKSNKGSTVIEKLRALGYME
jgi:Arc/MetJ-type ribon-helix-helix transcriptional regulator